MIVYDEPYNTPIGIGVNYRFDIKNIDDFSDTNNINMNDYYQAFSNPENNMEYKEYNNIDNDVNLEFKKRTIEYN